MDCLFCKIINGEIPAYKIYEDDIVFAFLDVNPHGNGHTLIVPKKHYDDCLEIDNDLLIHMFSVGKKIHKTLENKLHCDGITYLHNYGNVQAIKHYHLHLIPRYEKEEKLAIEEVYQLLNN